MRALINFVGMSLEELSAMSWTPTSVLAQAVYAAGFLYDPDQDIIYSRMDALQRNFGYAFGYDAAALAMNAVIDCEPIFFDYGGKHWMIELWKGQYGLETGCEIGVYTRPIGSTGVGYALLDATVGVRPGDGVPSHNLFYDCASDADRLELSATLRRNGTVLFTRGPEMHWWLTGFKWGVLSDPSQLSVDVAITLKDDAMRDAFMAGISGRPYPNLQINGTTVSFTFVEPFARPQPPRPGPVLAAVEAANEEIVSSYDALGFPNNDPNDVQAEFLSVAGLGILHLGDHYGLIAAQLATELGQDIGSVVSALVDGFGVAASTAEGWLNGAVPEFASWVSAVEQYFGLPLDFSCYVAVDNTQGSSDLLLAGSSATSGSYVISPPTWIPKGAVGRFVIQDPKPSIYGSQGSATYTYADADLVMHVPHRLRVQRGRRQQTGVVPPREVRRRERPVERNGPQRWASALPHLRDRRRPQDVRRGTSAVRLSHRFRRRGADRPGGLPGHQRPHLGTELPRDQLGGERPHCHYGRAASRRRTVRLSRR
jgi:Domain of unknown function (DUF4474)